MIASLTSRARARAAAVALGVVAVLAVGIACAPGTPANPAALTVDGWSVSRKDFLAVLSSVEGSEAASQLASVTPSSSAAAPGGASLIGGSSTTGPVSPDNAARLLTFVIEQRLVTEDLARRNLSITEADRTAAKRDVSDQLETPEMFADFGSLESTVVDGLAARKVLAELLGADNDMAADARAYYDQQRELAVQQAEAAKELCAQIILLPYADASGGQTPDGLPAAVPTPDSAADLAVRAQAEAIVDQVEAGTPFVDLVKSVNTDAQLQATADEPACIPVSNLPATITALPLDQISAPERTQDGYYLFVVKKVQGGDLTDFPTYESVEAQLVAAMQLRAGTQELATAIEPFVRRAEVHVDPLFGTWNPATGLVDPPTGSLPAPTIPTTLPEIPADLLAPGATQLEPVGSDDGASDIPDDSTETTGTTQPAPTTGSSPSTTVAAGGSADSSSTTATTARATTGGSTPGTAGGATAATQPVATTVP